MKLNLTELADGYVLDSYTIEDVKEFALEVIKIHKNLKGELVNRLETGKPFNNAPIGVNNPEAYEFLQGKLLKFAQMFEEDEMKFKLKKEKWEYIKNNSLPWTDKDLVNLKELEQQIEYCRYNARLTRQRLEILEILRKKMIIQHYLKNFQ